MRHVNKLRVWSWVGVALVATVALAACGGSSGSSGDTTSLRLVNATLTHSSLDLLVNGSAAISGTTSDTASAYVTPGSGAATLQLNDSSTGTALSTTIPTLSGNAHYAMLAYESGGTLKTALLTEDYAAPASGTAQIRIYNTALDAGKLDVYITAPAVDLATLTAPTRSITSVAVVTSTELLTYSPGTYRVRITGYGNKSDVRADITAITLANQQIATVVLTPTAGGVLLNGSLLMQQGAYAATRNSNARVRLAAAVSGSASVAASASSGTSNITIDSGSVAPAFGYYVLVPANSTLNINVNGQSIAAPAGTLSAGADSTLLVYGSAAAATAALIADDNRSPNDSPTVKLRLINGITGTVGALTMTANTSLVANGTQPGTASAYVSVPGSVNAMNLSLTSSASPGIFYSNTSNILNVNSVYSVLAGGDFAAPQLLIR